MLLLFIKLDKTHNKYFSTSIKISPFVNLSVRFEYRFLALKYFTMSQLDTLLSSCNTPTTTLLVALWSNLIIHLRELS